MSFMRACRLLPLLCLPVGRTVAAEPAAPSIDRFDAWIRAEFPVADGFDLPVGDTGGSGGSVAGSASPTHSDPRAATGFAERHSLGVNPSEDSNGVGGAQMGRVLDVHAIAHGRVVFAKPCSEPWGNVVMVDHVFYENHERRSIRSTYGHLGEIDVRAGETVRRGDVLGRIGGDPGGHGSGHLHLELRRDLSLDATCGPSSNGKDRAWVNEHYEEPSSFIAAHRVLPVPQSEAALILVDTEARKMRLYLNGRGVGTFEVGFGQGVGRKRRLGDLCTPLGMYFVTSKSRGPFPGRWGAFYGGHWIKVNYPNAFDAARGREQKLITADQAQRIARAWERREPTWEASALGGGLGFHGWAGDWDLAGPRRLSWGCVVMRNADIAAIFSRIPARAMVVLF
jgi:hypothetical protein